MTDFSKTLFYCSTLSKLMSPGKERTPFQEWENRVEELAKKETVFAKFADKKSVGQLNRLRRIEELKVKIAELDPIKDEIVLPVGCKSYLSNIYAWERYKKWRLPSSDESLSFIEKGLCLEDQAIDLINKLDDRVYSKNDTKFANDYVVGIPDIIAGDYLIDVKSSWDINTFFTTLTKPLKLVYWWQMQGYFYLTGIKSGEVSFCLLTTPITSIEEYIAEVVVRGKYSREDIIQKLSYDDIPLDERRIRFLVERDDEAIAKISQIIPKCREYLAVLEDMHTKPVPATNRLSDPEDTQPQEEVA